MPAKLLKLLLPLLTLLPLTLLLLLTLLQPLLAKLQPLLAKLLTLLLLPLHPHLPSNSGSRNEKPAIWPVFFRPQFAATARALSI